MDLKKLLVLIINDMVIFPNNEVRIEYDNVFDKVSKITPVPGGVGPMTVVMLMENVLLAYKNHHK